MGSVSNEAGDLPRPLILSRDTVWLRSLAKPFFVGAETVHKIYREALLNQLIFEESDDRPVIQ
jgi:hypothetical protein